MQAARGAKTTPRKPDSKTKVHAHELDLQQVLKSFGGKFPVCKGKRYRYPKPDDHVKWMNLIARAYTHRNRIREAFKQGKVPPKRNFKLEYAMYHCKQDQVSRRAKRNKHREIIARNKDLKGKDVHHTDPRNLTLASARVLTEKEHQQVHRRRKS